LDDTKTKEKILSPCGRGQGEGLLKTSVFAKELRCYQTDAEKLFWSKVRNRGFEGLKFRRQVLFGTYILDFVCFEPKLVVEIDGGQHNGSLKDGKRDDFLKSEGFVVKRYWNNEVLGNIEGVLTDLSETVRSLEE
jgi:very-short-patch-repair endonuclease